MESKFLPQMEMILYVYTLYKLQVLLDHVCFSSVDHYLIKHNVSTNPNVITVVNRTNLTILGVQPGDTYFVEITPYIEILGNLNSSVFYVHGTLKVNNVINACMFVFLYLCAMFMKSMQQVCRTCTH